MAVLLIVWTAFIDIARIIKRTFSKVLTKAILLPQPG